MRHFVRWTLLIFATLIGVAVLTTAWSQAGADPSSTARSLPVGFAPFPKLPSGHQTVAAAKPAGAPAAAPTAVPAAPFVSSATGDGLSVAVAWLPNADTDQVSSYAMTATPVAGSTTTACPSPTAVTATASGTSSAGWVRGLCAQVAYRVTMKATNSVGTSAASPASAPAVPLVAQVPAAPAITQVLGRSGQLQIAWSASASNGGSAILDQALVVKNPAGTVVSTTTSNASATSATVTGLTNGTTYTVSLTARNAVGSSTASTATGTPSVAYKPSAPTLFTVKPGSGSGAVAVSWAAPADNGGAAITGYTVTYQQATQNSTGAWTVTAGSAVHTLTTTGSATTVTATAFEDTSKSYLFSITATNSAGVGTAATSNAGIRPVTTVKAGVITLSDATVAAIASTSSTSVSWSTTPSQLANVAVGNVIVAPASAKLPDGMLRKVTAKSTSGGLTLTTTDAAVNDVFSAMSLSSTLDVNSDSAAAGGSKAPGVRSTFIAASPGVREIPKVTVSGSVSASRSFALERKIGAVKVSAQLDLGADVGVDLSVDTSGVRVDAEASISASLAGTVELGGGNEWKIGEIEGVPTNFQIGPVPVVIQPSVPIFLTVDGKIAIHAETSIRIGAAAHWNSNNPGTLRVENLSQRPTVSAGVIPGVTATGTGSIGLKADAIATLYGTGGPSVNAELSLNGDVNFLPSPGDDFLSVGAQLELSAGLSIHRFGLDGDLSVRVGLWNWPGFSIKAPPTASYAISAPSNKVPVGSSLQLTATRSDGQAAPVTWAVQGGVSGDSVSSSGLFRPANPATRTVTITAADSTGAGGTYQVTIGKAFDTPTIYASQHSDNTDVDVSWSTPTNTGDGTLSGYAVTVDGGRQNWTYGTDTTSLTAEGVAPGRHTFTVYARNSAGAVSSPGTTSIYVTPLCGNAFTGGPSGSGTDWNTASNWSKNRVPGTGEWVCLNNSVVIPSGTSASVAGFAANGYNLTLNGALTVSTYLDGINTLDGSGSFTAGQTLDWTAPQ